MKLPSIFNKNRDVNEPAVEPAQTEDGRLTNLTPGAKVRGLSNIYTPDAEPVALTHVRDIADVLLELAKINDEQLSRLRQQQASDPGCDSVSWLLREKVIEPDDAQLAKAHLYGYAFQRIAPSDVNREVFEKLNRDYILRSSILPVRAEEDVLVVATSEPSNVLAIEDVKRQTQMTLKIVVCRAEDIEAVCESFREDVVDYDLDDIISDMTEVEVVQDEQDDSEDLERMAGESPVIKYVNFLISNAIREGASDIHIEPKAKHTRIRYRIDGVLFEIKQAPIKMHPALVSRIKIMANLDISERRLPQDGKVSVIVGGRAVDLRVSTLPTNNGEKTVIRVLDSRSILRGLEQLGMEEAVCATFQEQIALPHGVFLVTGPTGSGKSTTLYTALGQMDGERLNVSTVEDPVEYELDFCNQVHVNDTIGLTFGAALRSLLRQDPDIIMIGEIRDNETARIAVQAALTGHLVLSTLHTNDAASSVTRLVNIGIDAYLIAASLNAVLAQRLVRRICPKCKEPYKTPDMLKHHLERAGISPSELCYGVGCDNCRGSGFAGRVGIYELLVVDDRFRSMINKDASVVSMKRAFMESGAPSLYDDGMRKVKLGLTTVDEVLRVTEVYGQTEDEVFMENER